jgi:hypothetical protein
MPTPRYNLAIDNMEKLLYNTKKYLQHDDIIQLERDVFYLKLFRKVSLKETPGGRS